MARLTAPLLSLGASGSIAKSLVFSSWKGIPYARVHVIPANPNSTLQQDVRGVFATLNEMYKRMNATCRLPWEYAVRGVALTARNRFIQASAAAMKSAADLDDLVLSVGTGQAIAPTEAWSHDEADGTVTLMCTPSTPAVGYTQTHITYFAVLDGDPIPKLTRTMLTGERIVAPWHIILDCPVNGEYQWAAVARFTRDSDSMPFCSPELRSMVTCTGN